MEYRIIARNIGLTVGVIMMVALVVMLGTLGLYAAGRERLKHETRVYQPTTSQTTAEQD